MIPPLRLNLGSGQRKFAPPFLNVDVNPKWEPDVVADCSRMPMFEDNSADLIVSHHHVEHFGCGEADLMIRECHRILAPGGSLLVFVPDALALAKAYANGDITDYIFAVNMMGAFMDSEADRHKWQYSYRSMSTMLNQAGPWARVKRFDWRKILAADIARDFWIMGVEAVK